MKKIKLSIVVFAIIALSTACFKVATTSEIPKIEFISFEVFDSTGSPLGNTKAGILKFRFEDGDGNIGVFDPDKSDTTNLKLTLYRKIDGDMRLVTDNTDPLLPGPDYTIPYLKTVGQSKVLRGEIAVILLYTSYRPQNQSDIIKYVFFITDRAGNQSNIEATAEIIANENGIYRK